MSLHRPILTRMENGRKVRGCNCGKPEGVCGCPRAEFWYCAFQHRGRQIMRCTGTGDRREAAKFEARLLKGLRSDRFAAVLEALDSAMMVRRVCTLGEVLDAYESPAVSLIDPAVARRNARSLVLVVAWARDLWMPVVEGRRREPDAARVRRLAASVLTKELVREYQRARLGTEGVDYTEVAEGARTVNSTLMKARDVFSKEAVMEKMGELTLPDLRGFRGAKLLRQAEARPEPLSAAEFDKMCAEADGFLESAEEGLRKRGMMNLMLRQTGLRVGSLRRLDGSWVRKVGDAWVCDVRDVKGGTEPYTIPVSERFAEFARESAPGVPLFAEGWKELWRGHNDWLAGIIGGRGLRTQKAHRLRDTAGTIVKCWLGLPAAVELLGHANASMTIKSYAKLQWEVSERMKLELGAARRLVAGSGA